MIPLEFGTASLPEIVLTLVALALTVTIAYPNYRNAQEDLRWVREQNVNGQAEYLGQIQVAQERVRLLQLLLLAGFGALFMTVPTAQLTWRAWVFYGTLLVLGGSIGWSCWQQRQARLVINQREAARRRDSEGGLS